MPPTKSCCLRRAVVFCVPLASVARQAPLTTLGDGNGCSRDVASRCCCRAHAGSSKGCVAAAAAAAEDGGACVAELMNAMPSKARARRRDLRAPDKPTNEDTPLKKNMNAVGVLETGQAVV